MLSTNIIKLPWEKPNAQPFFLRPLPCVTGTPPWLLRPEASTSSELYPDTMLFFCECLGIQFFNSLTCDLQDTMPPQRSLTLFTHMWLTGHYAMPEVIHTLFPTQLFLPWALRIWKSIFYSQAFFTLHSLYLGKRRISLGVVSILSMYLRLHT